MPTNTAERKLREVLREVNLLKKAVQHSELMLSTPPKNIEDCCCRSALDCFRDNVNTHFNVTEKVKLHRSLKKNITVNGLCNAGTISSTCQECNSHTKENVQVFFDRLESLIQRAIVRLSMN